MNALRRFIANVLLCVGVGFLTIIVALVIWLLPEHEADELKKEIF